MHMCAWLTRSPSRTWHGVTRQSRPFRNSKRKKSSKNFGYYAKPKRSPIERRERSRDPPCDRPGRFCHTLTHRITPHWLRGRGPATRPRHGSGRVGDAQARDVTAWRGTALLVRPRPWRRRHGRRHTSGWTAVGTARVRVALQAARAGSPRGGGPAATCLFGQMYSHSSCGAGTCCAGACAIGTGYAGGDREAGGSFEWLHCSCSTQRRRDAARQTPASVTVRMGLHLALHTRRIS